MFLGGDTFLDRLIIVINIATEPEKIFVFKQKLKFKKITHAKKILSAFIDDWISIVSCDCQQHDLLGSLFFSVCFRHDQINNLFNKKQIKKD